MAQEEKRDTAQNPQREREGKENVGKGTEAGREQTGGQAAQQGREQQQSQQQGRTPQGGQAGQARSQGSSTTGGRGTTTVQEPAPATETVRCDQCGDTFDSQQELTQHNSTAHK